MRATFIAFACEHVFLSGISILIVLAGALVFSSCRRRTPPPPGVILVSLDALRSDRLNVYGYKRRRLSPFIDKFAQDSVLFQQAVTASPWTTPSHLSLLTSLNPLNHGVTTPFFALMHQLNKRRLVQSLSPENVTLAEVLRSAGYSTAAFTGGVTLDPSIGFSQGFDVYETSMFKVNDPAMKRMLGWIDSQQQRSFFLFWHTFETHDPYHVTEFLREVASESTANEVEKLLAELITRFFKGQAASEQRARLDAIAAVQPEITSALYDGGVLTADKRFKQLLDHLRRTGRYDNTMIILTSDHGEELGERGTRGIFGRHGHNLFEECLSVPLIIKLPGQAHAGTRLSATVGLIDVMPTILDVLSVAGDVRAIQGHSLRPLWQGAEKHDRLVLSESLAYAEEKKSVRSGRWKYIVNVSPEEVARHGRTYLPTNDVKAELYDLVADPQEKRNLIGKEGMARGVVEKFGAILVRHVARAEGRPSEAEVSRDTVDRLKALGYIN